VFFRLDDIQDYYVEQQQIAIMNIFKELNESLTVGIIANHFGTHPPIFDFIKSNAFPTEPSPTNWVLELAEHGYDHENFTAFNYSMQFSLLQKSNDNFRAWFNGWTPKGFIPPFNLYNEDTVAALIANGYTHISAEVDLDPSPYSFDNFTTFYRTPIEASTNDQEDDFNFIGVTHNTTYDQIISQLANYGFAGVLMHPMEFTEISGFVNGTAILNEGGLNHTMLNELRLLLRDLKTAGIRVVPMSKVNYWYQLNGTEPVIIPTVPTVPTITVNTVPTVSTAPTVDTNTNIGINPGTNSSSPSTSAPKPTTPATSQPVIDHIESSGSQTVISWLGLVLVVLGLAAL
jgi:peptidoglycan/xylan/chitin deacetylase (PgdA/CDA1 family)